MKIRADFAQHVAVRPGDEAWVASPQPGVDRLMLDRIGEEIARATSLVRFAPGSFFPFHEHGGGEEIFVLDGVFEDEHGSYPAGTYLRDPTGTSHTPFTREGCTLFVKLWQFAPGDTTRKVVDTRRGGTPHGAIEGLEILPLHVFGAVSVAIEKLAPGFAGSRRLHASGEELLVVEGTLVLGSEPFPKGSWLRNPGGSEWEIASEHGCRLLVTTGHLAHIVVPA
jgi:anti-sigma factor ChrR (cupin superfamily)